MGQAGPGREFFENVMGWTGSRPILWKLAGPRRDPSSENLTGQAGPWPTKLKCDGPGRVAAHHIKIDGPGRPTSVGSDKPWKSRHLFARHACAVRENQGSRGTVIINHGIFTARIRVKRITRYLAESRHLPPTAIFLRGQPCKSQYQKCFKTARKLKNRQKSENIYLLVEK